MGTKPVLLDKPKKHQLTFNLNPRVVFGLLKVNILYFREERNAIHFIFSFYDVILFNLHQKVKIMQYTGYKLLKHCRRMKHTDCAQTVSAYILSVQDNLHNRKRKAATLP